MRIFCVLHILLGNYHRLSYLILMANILNRHYQPILQRWELRHLKVTQIVPNSIPKLEPHSLQILKLAPSALLFVWWFIYFLFFYISLPLSSSLNMLVNLIQFFVCLFRKSVLIFWAFIFNLLMCHYIIYLILFVTFSPNIVLHVFMLPHIHLIPCF